MNRPLPRVVPALLALVVLASVAAGRAHAQTGNPAHDALAARSQSEQRSELLALVRQSGQACSDLIAILFAGLDEQRTAYWDGRCRDGTIYRVGLPAPRWARPGVVSCAALAPPPAGGPCFQSVLPASAEARPAFGATAGVEQTCRTSCASQPPALLNACMARCQQGLGVEAGRQSAAALPTNSRFGAMYHADLPLGAVGFANGATDRLEVNMRALRACQAQAGRTACKFEAEVVNGCGALAQAVRRSPGAAAVTSDIGTFMVNQVTTGTGTTQAAAEQAALSQCRRFEGPGVTCRIAVSGC